MDENDEKKLGIVNDHSEDEALILELLSWMHSNKADYTNTFCHLMDELQIEDDIYDQKSFLTWKKKWQTRIKLNNNSVEDLSKLWEKKTH